MTIIKDKYGQEVSLKDLVAYASGTKHNIENNMGVITRRTKHSLFLEDKNGCEVMIKVNNPYKREQISSDRLIIIKKYNLK